MSSDPGAGVRSRTATELGGPWLCVTDERLGLDYEISSHADYWDFLGYFADGKQWPVCPFPRGEVA